MRILISSRSSLCLVIILLSSGGDGDPAVVFDATADLDAFVVRLGAIVGSAIALLCDGACASCRHPSATAMTWIDIVGYGRQGARCVRRFA